jgi:hypothetical protein
MGSGYGDLIDEARLRAGECGLVGRLVVACRWDEVDVGKSCRVDQEWTSVVLMSVARREGRWGSGRGGGRRVYI